MNPIFTRGYNPNLMEELMASSRNLDSLFQPMQQQRQQQQQQQADQNSLNAVLQGMGDNPMAMAIREATSKGQQLNPEMVQEMLKLSMLQEQQAKAPGPKSEYDKQRERATAERTARAEEFIASADESNQIYDMMDKAKEDAFDNWFTRIGYATLPEGVAKLAFPVTAEGFATLNQFQIPAVKRLFEMVNPAGGQLAQQKFASIISNNAITPSDTYATASAKIKNLRLIEESMRKSAENYLKLDKMYQGNVPQDMAAQAYADTFALAENLVSKSSSSKEQAGEQPIESPAKADIGEIYKGPDGKLYKSNGSKWILYKR